MKRARSPQVQDDAISDQERASSRRRTSGSSSLDNVQPVAGHNRQSVTSQASEGDAEVDGDDHEESVKSNAESASSLQDWDDPSAVVESFSPNPWGFVVYRTVYGDEDAWHAFRLKLNTIIGEQREFIESEGADPQSMTLEFIEDEATLNNATSQQIRLYACTAFLDIITSLKSSLEVKADASSGSLTRITRLDPKTTTMRTRVRNPLPLETMVSVKMSAS